jgi:DNA-binding MarR family transcriptional regulator
MYTVNMESPFSITEQLPTLGALLRLPLETLLDYVYEELSKAGYVELRVAHGAVFRHISRDGSRITTLAARARITKQSMAELIEYLRSCGYVELVADPTDGRAKLARLTARGWKVHRALGRISEAFQKNALAASRRRGGGGFASCCRTSPPGRNASVSCPERGRYMASGASGRIWPYPYRPDLPARARRARTVSVKPS